MPSVEEFGIDVSQVPGYQAVKDTDPEWKRAMLEKKNQEAVANFLRMKEVEDAEKKKWENIPEWRRDLILKKEKQRKEEEALSEEDRRKQDEENAKIASMPPWKRELYLKKKTEDNNEQEER